MRPDVTDPDWVTWFEKSRHVLEREQHAAARLPAEPVEPVGTERLVAQARPQVPSPVAAAPGVPPGAAPPPPQRVGVRRSRTAVVLVASVLAMALAAGAWWSTHRATEPEPRVRQAGADARPALPPRPPVRLAAGERHTQVLVRDSGDLVVEDWLRGPGGSVSYQRHRLTGGLERDGTRALVRLEPLSLGAGEERTIDVVGARVLTLACASGGGMPLSCGEDAGSHGWRVVGPGATPDAEVLIQLDLPNQPD